MKEQKFYLGLRYCIGFQALGIAIFKKPTPAAIHWRDAASLIKALGDEIQYGDTSRVRIDLKGESLNLHSPHPQKELKRYAVRLVKELLTRTGDTP